MKPPREDCPLCKGFGDRLVNDVRQHCPCRFRKTDPATRPKGGGAVKLGKHAKGRSRYYGQAIKKNPTAKPWGFQSKTLLERAEAGEPLSHNEIRKLEKLARGKRKRKAAGGR